MIQEIEIRTMEAVQELLFQHSLDDRTGRYRNSWFYRGVPDASFELTTSLHRNCGHLAETLERPMLESFIKYVSIEDPTISESIWKAMILGQHHGLPTRLLDWTASTLSAMHFATTEADPEMLDQHDCAIWRIDARELNRKLPPRYRAVLDVRNTFVFSLSSFESLTKSMEDYDRDMGGEAFVTLEPPSIDQRIVSQYGFFTVIPSGIIDMVDYLDQNTERTVKYIIDRNLRWEIRDILDQLNINERMICPGMDGIARWLGRHYFVRNG